MTEKKTQEQIIKMKSRLTKFQDQITNMIRDISMTSETSNVYWNKKIAELKNEYNKIKWTFKSFSTDILSKDFENKLKAALEKIKGMKSLKNYKALLIYKELKYKEFINTDRISNMKANSIKLALTDFALGIDNGVKRMTGLIRGTQQKLINEKQINKMIETGFEKKKTWQGSMKKLYNSLEEGKIISILCKDGITRNYDPKYYAEMVVRTRMRENKTNITKQTALEYDTDLVQVSSHNTTCPICQEYEGKIYSIGGLSKDFPALDEEPPYHPHCLHLLIIQFREILENRGIEQFTAFSNGEIDAPPYIPSYIPISERKDRVS
jgi:hypothetical protein